MNAIKALELVLSQLRPGMGYKACVRVIENIISNIKEEELAKLLALGEKFDVNHMDYDKLLERGHIDETTDYHKFLSEFSMEKMSSHEVFNCLSDEHRNKILIDVVSDKGMNEQLVAHRHGFDFITHNTGHDGICREKGVFEVKNLKYKRPKKDARFSMHISFDRLSENTLRKMDEGRPTIILNSTDKHKLLIEMEIEFTDEIVNIYKECLKGVKDKKTSGTTIPFHLFSHAIRNVSYIAPDFESYNFSYEILKHLNEKHGTNFDTTKRPNICPNVYGILMAEKVNIIDMHKEGNAMTKIARGLATPDAKVTAQHVKKVITGEY